MDRTETRAQVAAVSKDLVAAVCDKAVIENGFTSLEASAYTLGYLESFVVNLITDLPATKRKMLLAEMRALTLEKLNSIKEIA